MKKKKPRGWSKMGENGSISGLPATFLIVSLLVLSGIVPMLLIVVEPTSGAVLYVGKGSTYDSIQKAVDSSSPGDTIVIGTGVYNESINVTKAGIRILGNKTAATIINSTAGEPVMNISANNVEVSGFTFLTGGLLLDGSNLRVSNVYFNITSQTGIVMSSCNNVTIINITLMNSVNGGLIARGSTNITITTLTSLNSTGDVVQIKDSSNILLNDTNLYLNSSSTGARFVNVSGINITSVSFLSSGSDNTGAILEKCYNNVIDGCVFLVDPRGITLRYCDRTQVSYSMFGAEFLDSSGMEVFSCTRTNISTSIFNVINGMVGSSVISSTYTAVDNSSFQMDSMDSVGILLHGSRSFKLQDSNGMVLGESATFVRATGSSDIWITASVMDLASNGSKSIDASGCSQLFVERNIMSSSASSTVLIDLYAGTDNSTIEDNMFDTYGEGSMAVHASGVRDLILDNNTQHIMGDISFGHLIEDVMGAEITNESVLVSAVGDVGVQISGQVFSVRSSSIAVPGSSSTGIFISDSRNGSVLDTDISVSGEFSTGLTLSSVDSDLILEDITVNQTSTSGLALVTHNEGGHVNISDVRVNSSSVDWYSMVLTGGTYDIEGLVLDSLGKGLLSENSPAGSMSGSTITAQSTGVAIANSVYEVTGSKISGLELMDRSHVMLLDSSVGQLMQITGESRLEVYNTVGIRTLSRDLQPIQGVDMLVQNWGVILYQTPFFNSSGVDPETDDQGSIRDIIMLDRIYFDVIDDPETGETNVTVHADGTSPIDWYETFIIDTSYPHTEHFVCPDIDLPAMPVNFSVRQVDTREALFLNWDPNTDDTIEYIIYSLDPVSGEQGVADRVQTGSASWISPDLGPSRKMFYWVTAWDGTWESEPTEVVQGVTKDLTPPSQPQLLSHVSSTKDSITISWTHPGGDDLYGFLVFMSGPGSMDFEVVDTLGPEARTYTATSLNFGSSYRFQVQAFDTSYNYSPLSGILQASTDLPTMEIRVIVHYGSTGPKAGLSADNCTLELLSFNSSVMAVTRTNETGTGSVIGRDPYESYFIRAYPPLNLLGEIGTRSGYLPVTSDAITLDPDVELLHIELTFDHYMMSTNGTIRIRVVYGEGPRTGAVYGALIKLEHENGTIIDQKMTSADGNVMFTISNLPQRGRFQVIPPDGVRGDQARMISGYVNITTNFFELTLEKPDQNMGDVVLEYYSYIPEPEDLMLTSMSPYGSAVDLGLPVIINFNQPVVTGSVEGSLLIAPSLRNPVFFWYNENMSLRIEHDGFLAGTEYMVSVGYGAVSEAGTTFPPGYTNNTWSFTTTAMPDSGDRDNSRSIIYALAIGAVLLVIILLIYSRVSSRKDREEDEPYSSRDGSDEYVEEMELDDEEYFDDDEKYEDDLPYEDDHYEDEDDLAEDEDLEEYEEDLDEDDMTDMYDEEEIEEMDEFPLQEGRMGDEDKETEMEELEPEEEPMPAMKKKEKKSKKK
ncbi:MAG: fibronectin type III domain-containing protein [Candidatus Thermoplasmatota archaeon]|nr:fibronectin type III domain-containing protein [Candidatus Thermoplasmatota archaeon]